MLLLFQNLDGVDVCLYCLYVQEYGADCPAPNTNAVYLSYLDSVKYFRPESNSVIKAGGGVSPLGANGQVTGMALRTFVYHQLLIGYLEFVKNLGYQQMYIWACPPMQVRAPAVACPRLPSHLPLLLCAPTYLPYCLKGCWHNQGVHMRGAHSLHMVGMHAHAVRGACGSLVAREECVPGAGPTKPTTP